MANVFVTGGSGFIGRALIRRLITKATRCPPSYEAKKVLSWSPRSAPAPYVDGWTNRPRLRLLLPVADILFHLAAQTDMAAELNAHVAVTVNGTRAALDAARSASVPISSHRNRGGTACG